MLSTRSVIIYQWKKLFITSLEFSHLLRGNTEFCVCILILPAIIWSVLKDFQLLQISQDSNQQWQCIFSKLISIKGMTFESQRNLVEKPTLYHFYIFHSTLCISLRSVGRTAQLKEKKPKLCLEVKFNALSNIFFRISMMNKTKKYHIWI